MTEPSPTTHAPRFYCPPLADAPPSVVSDAVCELDKAESHHAMHVLRLSVDDPVTLFNGRGVLASANILSFEGRRVTCRLLHITQTPKPEPVLTVASAVPKGPRADAMIDQLSQLGVDSFIPLKCEHSVAVPKEAKIEKFARSAIESAKQCGRSWLMNVEQPKHPHDVWTDDRYDLKLLAAPGGEAMPDLTARLKISRDALVLIGPEGGWSESELTSATHAGCLTWRIAPHILRIETAATTAASILRYPGGA